MKKEAENCTNTSDYLLGSTLIQLSSSLALRRCRCRAIVLRLSLFLHVALEGLPRVSIETVEFFLPSLVNTWCGFVFQRWTAWTWFCYDPCKQMMTQWTIWKQDFSVLLGQKKHTHTYNSHIHIHIHTHIHIHIHIHIHTYTYIYIYILEYCGEERRRCRGHQQKLKCRKALEGTKTLGHQPGRWY